jgi:S1-C subfamily serine protease
MSRPSVLFLASVWLLLFSTAFPEAPITAEQEPLVRMVNRVYMAVVNIKTDRGAGSGFFIDASGLVVTNAHVIDDAREIVVRTEDGQSLPAKVIGEDAGVDLALLKVEPTIAPTVIRLDDPSPNMLGQTLVVIGNPLDVGTSVTRGILSARKRTGVVEGRKFAELIQTDASVHPGNSGGPVLDISGKLAGVTRLSRLNAPGLNLAIPVDVVREKVQEFLRK